MNLDQIKTMAHSPLHNYAIPGLTSWIIGANPNPVRGCVRLFECSRDHFETIIPHSHRFDFQCLVLRGGVVNVTWTEDDRGDEFAVSSLEYGGEAGHYSYAMTTAVRKFSRSLNSYKEGEWYGMKHDEIHSIFFGRDTSVLFFEGPRVSNQALILEPYVDGQRVPTFKVESWMFRKGEV